jgi:hypothetical protein
LIAWKVSGAVTIVGFVVGGVCSSRAFGRASFTGCNSYGIHHRSTASRSISRSTTQSKRSLKSEIFRRTVGGRIEATDHDSRVSVMALRDVSMPSMTATGSA